MDTEDVKRFIVRNVKRVSGLRPLAAELHISPEKLRKQFRKVEGIPISKFITLAKVERAKDLLRRTDKYCFEICFEAGFSREDGGSRVFKRVTGMTMEEYREVAKDPGRNACSC